jgi:DNA-binding NtrC family response regulator
MNNRYFWLPRLCSTVVEVSLSSRRFSKVVAGNNGAVQATMQPAEDMPRSAPERSLVFADPVSCKLFALLERTSRSDAPVLIQGETGTGKELVARHIHLLSGRTGPFLAVNCGAITESLAESELFGHESGAFTGAVGRREGWFEAANNGTLFLDEIGDLPLRLQVKLLRVLQEREVVRLGARRAIPVNVRFVTATNIDLNAAVSAGHFRLDLFYRLNIVQMQLPALRERPGDIVPLASHFLNEYSRRLKLPLPYLGEEAIEALQRHPWVGNIRELENVIHYALLVASDQEIRPEHLKLNNGAEPRTEDSTPAHEPPRSPFEDIATSLRKLVDAGQQDIFNSIERAIIVEAFRHGGENQVRVASQLGISRSVLRTLLKRHGLIESAGGPPDPVTEGA